MTPGYDRKPTRQQWPYPGDTPLQRTRRYLHAYRQHLKTANPELCAALDDAARAYGDDWVCGELLTIPDDQMLTTAEAAEYVGVDIETVRQWRKRGYVSPTGAREHLQVRGLSERGWPMFRAAEVKAIADTTRRNRLSKADS
ncbi:helix-turn-helix domain-containing protein [Micromonospora tulbaghiae]|uniref:helix-turn-helix domain-containing protein n=1 Tax=Micromonospora tulbaghiae TaxID=479978 RepID=UPI0033D2B282